MWPSLQGHLRLAVGWSDRPLSGCEIRTADVSSGSRLDGQTAQLIALKLQLEMTMSNQLTFAGDDAGQ